MSIPLSEDDAILNDLMLQTDEGKLLHHFGFVPVNTESSARRLAEKVVVLLKDLHAASEVVDGQDYIKKTINQILPQ